MGKKIRFALEMDNGVSVTTIEDLKENFSLERVIDYFCDGRLYKWLEDRHYKEEIEAIANLNKDDDDLGEKLCSIFKIEYNLDHDTIKWRINRRKRLSQYTEDHEILDNIENVAFDQSEFVVLLNRKVPKIYLCGQVFTMSGEINNVLIVGVNNPRLIVTYNTVEEYETNTCKYEQVNLHKVIPEEIRIKKLCEKYLKNVEYPKNFKVRCLDNLKKNLGVGNEEVFIAHDDALFLDEGNVGFIITNKGIYNNDSGLTPKPSFCSFSSLKGNGDLLIKTNSIFLGEKQLAYTTMLSTKDRNDLWRLLNEIKNM